MNHPDLANNEAFWHEWAEMNNPSDEDLMKLIEKHEPQLVKEKSLEGFKKEGRFQLKVGEDFPITSVHVLGYSPRAKIEVDRLAKGGNRKLIQKFDQFIGIISDPSRGLRGLGKETGAWKIEKLKYQENTYSARLNRHYRVIFRHDGESTDILEVAKDTTTHN